MRQILSPLGIALLILATGVFSQVQKSDVLKSILEIKPLISTRADVERRFGAPMSDNTDIAEYRLPEGRILVEYSPGTCSESVKSDYDARSGTVVELSFFILRDIDFGKTSIDVRGWEQQKAPDVFPSSVLYSNFVEGVEVEVGRGKLTWVHLFPGEPGERVTCRRKASGRPHI